MQCGTSDPIQADSSAARSSLDHVLRQHHFGKTAPKPHTMVTGHASAEVEENTIFSKGS